MSDRLEAERLFLQHLQYIRRVAARACARSGVRDDEAEDCMSAITTRLMEDDYAVIRDFRSTSKLTTYLAAVVVRQVVEYQRQRGGRWRVSAAAEREGPPAPELEKLVYRQGYTLSEAAELLRTAGRTTLTDTELARLLGRLPAREPLRPVQVSSDAVLQGAMDPGGADEHVAAAEGGAHRARVLAALESALAALDPEDREMAWMRIVDGHSVAEIARVYRLEQKPLYRRLDRVLKLLRAELETRGVSRADVAALMTEPEGE